MSRKSAPSPPGRPAAASAASTRLDVSSPPPALRQSPFAALARVSASPAPSSSPAAAEEPAAPPPIADRDKPPTSAGRLLLRRETKHRGGKTVVVISGFSALRDRSEARLHEVEKHLKARLGCGGSSDSARGEVLIQGDRPEAVAELLRGLGYEVAGVTSAPKSGRSAK